MSKLLWRVIAVLIFSSLSVAAQNPCTEQHSRALVMGGGGSKGAFQAGAVYHLVAHRGCDFVEISGTSVGALNGAILAQAQTEPDPSNSISRLKSQTDSLVSMWEGIRSTKDVVKGRPMATLRFGLFGLESMKNFQPLHNLLEKNVIPERLQDGRSLRVGTVSFNDGRYHELVLNGDGKLNPNAIDHLFGSAILPMFGTMPRIPVQTTAAKLEPVQFADGALRHTIPLNSYFQVCGSVRDEEKVLDRCSSIDGSVNPAHQPVEQLFVITTSPYERGQLVRPVFDPTAFSGNTRQIRDGRKVMSRALDLLMDTMYRSDLDSAYLHNDLLRWQAGQSSSLDGTTFPVRSYNVLPQETGLAPRPYVMAVIVPEKEDAEITAMLDFSPVRIAEQLYCGCVAADRMMQEEFDAVSMAGSCRERFRPKRQIAKSKNPVEPAWFTPEDCSGPDTNRQLAQAPPTQAPPTDATSQTSGGQHQ